MWYAMQVMTGKEEIVIQLCKKIIDDQILQECFIPKYEQKKRFHGQWHRIQSNLFPGYLFLVTDQIEALYFQLKKIPEMTKILGDLSCLIPLNDQEIQFLEQFGGKERIVKLSEGYIEGAHTIITKGPLQGREGQIVKIDRHKREAIIQVEMFGREMNVKVGMEIIKKD